MERLTNPDSGVIKFNDANLMAAIIDKLKIYEDAEEQGLLLRLPCKIGDKVFFIDKNFNLKANDSSFLDYEVTLKKIIASRKFDYYMIPDIGTKYFLTKEAAEEALKRLEG